MMTFPTDPTSRSYARLTGLFYLTIAVAGGYAIAYVPATLETPGDPAATITAIAANRGFFLSGIGGDVVMMLAEIMVTAMLFFMFRTAHPTLSLAAALARFAMVAVMATMLFFHAGLSFLIDTPIEGFDQTQRQSLSYLFLNMHHAGVWIWQVFFFLHLLILGQLVVASGFYPRLLGYALSLGSFGYLLDSIEAFAFPDATLLTPIRIALLAIVTLAEIGFALSLVFRGPRPAKR